MRCILRLAKRAVKDLAHLDRQAAQHITTKLESYLQSSNPLHHAKALTGVFKGLYRFRIGDYRVIFEIDKQNRISILLVLQIKHRKDLY